MTITVDIALEVEAALARRAAAIGQPVEAYAASLLKEESRFRRRIRRQPLRTG